AKIPRARVAVVDRVGAETAFEVNRVGPYLVPQRGQYSDQAGRLHSGNGADLREKPFKEPLPVVRLGVEIAAEAELHRENVVGVEAFIDLCETCETAREEACKDQQRCAQPDLEADQAFAKAQAVPALGNRMASGAQRFLRVVARHPPRGKSAEADA